MSRATNNLMGIWEIEKIVRKGAFTLGESLYQHWPGRPKKDTDNSTSDIPEANLTLHIGSAFIQAGFDCYAQHYFKNQGLKGKNGKELLDLFAISYKHRMQIRCEAKTALWYAGKAGSIGTDLERLERFTAFDTAEEANLDDDYDKKIGIMLISTWDQHVLEWWENPDSDKCPGERENEKAWGEIYDKLCEATDQEKEEEPKCIKGCYALSRSESRSKANENIEGRMGTHGMLYLIFEIK